MPILPLPLRPDALAIAALEAANMPGPREAAAPASPRHAGPSLATSLPRPTGSRRFAQSIVSRFGLGSAAQPGPSQPVTRPPVQSADEQRKQLGAAIDQWATTQEGSHILFAVTKLKEALSFGAVPGFLRRTERLSIDLSGFILTSIPKELAQAKALEMLNLDRNQLTSIPAELGQAKALKELRLNFNQLASIPKELGQAKALRMLCLNENQLTRIPKELGQAKALEHLILSSNQLTSIPKELGQAKALRELNLYDNQLTSIPKELGQIKALQKLQLSGNHLTSIPKELGQAKALRRLSLGRNLLNDLPAEIAQLQNLRHLNLSNNRYTQVPRALLLLPSTTEIDLQNNPLPDEEILAVRAAMAERRAAGLSVPHLILPGQAADAGELREAVANQMNVHSGVLTNAFQKRLAGLAEQFPDKLSGSDAQQRAEMKDIAERLTQALDAYGSQHAPHLKTFKRARKVADLMFQKGQGERVAYVNEFDRSAGHVLAYTFLAIEAQWGKTAPAYQQEAKQRGMAALIDALSNGSGMCDTRLCEEVMQIVGLPLSQYAQEHDDIIEVKPPEASATESQDVVFAAAKQVLQNTMADSAVSPSQALPTWRERLIEKIQSDHPKMPREHLDKCIQDIEAHWEEFHDLVVEQRKEQS